MRLLRSAPLRQTTAKLVTVMGIFLSLTLQPGCRSAPHRFQALMPNQPTVGSLNPDTEPKPPATALTKTRDIAWGGVKLVGKATAILAFWMVKESLEDDDEPCGFDPNPLWREGYGYNNPNNERIANGQPVLNFDGTVHKE